MANPVVLVGSIVAQTPPPAGTELNPWPIVGGALVMLVAIALLVFGVRRRIDEEAEDGPGGADDPER